MSTERHRGEGERRAVPRGGALRPLHDALFPVLRWIERHSRGFHTAVGAYLAAGLAAVLVLLLGFAGVAALVSEGHTQRTDEAILRWIDAQGSPMVDVLALEATTLGSGVVVWVVVISASVAFWQTRHRYSAALLWVAVVGGLVINTVLKGIFARPRPDVFPWRTPHVGLSSFPSGHAMGAAVVYATLAYLVARLQPTRALRRFTIAMAGFIIGIVAASRMYLGVHYPTDVLAGVLAGLVWAVVCALGIEAVRYFREREPAVEAQEHDLHAERERKQGLRA